LAGSGAATTDTRVVGQAARLLTVALLGIALGRLVHGLVVSNWLGWLGSDLAIYTEATRRVVSGGSWYLEHQLHGPYGIAGGDILYPPTIAWLFLPWLVLPAWTFIAVPIAVTAWVVTRLRPRPVAWPLMAFCLLWPDTQVRALAGNPGLWAMMCLALATLYRSPAAFILLKPTLAPFALFGVRSRRWWLALGAIVILSLPVLEQTLAYPRVVFDGSSGRLYYSFWDLPFMALPVLAWLYRTGSSDGRRLPRETAASNSTHVPVAS
jgi:hypothetical protein